VPECVPECPMSEIKNVG